MAVSGVQIVNLAAFRADIRRAISSTPTEMTKALKLAGEPVRVDASALSPRRTGTLAGGYKTSVRGATGSIISRVPYAGGAEWGRFGKWAGFAKYGEPGGRFAGKAVDEKADEIVAILTEGLNDVLTIYGFAT